MDEIPDSTASTPPPSYTPDVSTPSSDAAPQGGDVQSAAAQTDSTQGSPAPGTSEVAQQLQTDSFNAAGETKPPAQRDQGDTFQAAAAPEAAAAAREPMPTLESVQRGKDAIAQEVREATEARERERATDGQFVGPNGISRNKDEAGAFKPADGKLVSDKPIYFENGINTTAAEHAQMAQALADKTLRPVYAVHNATESLRPSTVGPLSTLKDVGQSIYSKVFGGSTAPSKTLANEINGALARGEPIDVYAHSQGAIDLSNAINAASRNLYRQGLSTDQVQQRLGNITAHTFGGAAQWFADGPQYVHHNNPRDYVAGPFGLGGYGFRDEMQHPGRGAVMDIRPYPGDPHSFMNYLQWAVPQARLN